MGAADFRNMAVCAPWDAIAAVLKGTSGIADNQVPPSAFPGDEADQ